MSKRLKFSEIPQGTHFSDGRRKFIKFQHVLPSGLSQEVHRSVDGRLLQEAFNAVDYQGTLAKCPDWCEFVVLDLTPKPKVKRVRRTKLCNICKTARVPVGVHACEVCE